MNFESKELWNFSFLKLNKPIIYSGPGKTHSCISTIMNFSDKSPKWGTNPLWYSWVGSIERSMLALSVALAPLNWTYHATFNCFPRPLFTAHYFSHSPGWAVDYFLAVRVVNGFRHEEANSQDHWPSSDLHSGVTFEVPCGFQKVVSTRF